MPAPNSFSGGHACVLKQTSGQSVGNGGADTIATWDTLLLDTAGAMFASGSNTRITIAEAGWYKVGAALGWSASNSSRRTFWSYYKNGSVSGMVNVQVGPSTNGYGSSVFEMPILLAAADYLQMGLFQDGTGASATLQNPAFFWAYRMPW